MNLLRSEAMDMWYPFLATILVPIAWLRVNQTSNAAQSIVISTSLFVISTFLSFVSVSHADETSTTILIAVVSAVVGALAVVIAAFITGWLPAHLEQRKIANEQKKQKKEEEVEEAKNLMIQAKNLRDRVRIYRQAIQADPRISTLQILEMNRPLKVDSIYVRLRLQQENFPNYKISADLLEAEAKRDPNILFKAEQRHLETRINMALSPEDALLTYKHCVVVGDPGAGKTTLLKYMALKSASGQIVNLPKLPIHVELNAFAVSDANNLLEFASQTWQERYNFPKFEALAYMKKSLEEGQALLLLDALDETVIGSTPEEAEISYNRIITLITDLATRYYLAPIVVTIRKAGYHQRAIRLKGFTELEVLDFRPDDIKLFINQWFAILSNKRKTANAEDLILRLERNSRLLDLAANPLLLSLITIVYEAQLELPDRRAELYKQCIDILLTKWDAERNIVRRREFKPEHKKQLLQEIAWYFHYQGQRYFSDAELLKVIANFLPAIGLSSEQSSSVLREIAAENGLLKEQAHGWHGFLHLSLQEYFVAQYVNDHNLIRSILPYRHISWWEEVILLYAGLASDASLLIQELLAGDTELPLEMAFRPSSENSDLILAAHVLIARPTIRQTNLRREVLTRLFRTLRQVQRGDIRQTVAFSLVDIGDKEINTHLIQLLVSNQTTLNIRQCIVYALIRLRKYFAIRELLQLISDSHTDEALRETILHEITSLDINGICSILEKSERQVLIPRVVQNLRKLYSQHRQSDVTADDMEKLFQFLKRLQ